MANRARILGQPAYDNSFFIGTKTSPLNPHVRRFGWPVVPLVCQNFPGGELHFHAPIGALAS